MPWRPLPRIAFAIAVYPFAPSAPADLPLELGDELYIIEEGGIDGAWLRGYLVAPPSLLSGLTSTKGQTLEARVFSGIFPRSCVEIREYIGGDTDTESASTREGSVKTGEIDPDGYPFLILGGITAEKHLQKQQQPNFADFQKGQSNGTAPSSVSSPTTDTRVRASSVTGPVTPNSLNPREGRLPRPPAPVPMLKIGDETPTCADEPLVDEIASCLREWHSTNLHELLLSRQYGKLTKLTRLMNRLDMARRQLLHGVLTAQEVEDLHEKVVWDMVKGNKLVNNEIIIRDPKLRGRLLTFKDDVVEITKLTAAMALLDAPAKPPSETINLHHVLVEVTDVVSNLRGSSPSLLVAVYRKVPGETPVRLTESFAAEAPQADKRNPNRLRTLFPELTPFDIGELSGSDADLYLVVKVQATVEVRPTPQPPSRAGTGRLPTSAAEGKGPSSESSGKENGGSSSGRGIKTGRRSLLWGANRLGTARRKINPPATIEETPASQTPHNERDGAQRPSTARGEGNVSPNPPQATPPPNGPPQTAKRDIGVAVLRLKDIFTAPTGTENDHTVAVFSPAEHATAKDPINDDWSSVVPEVMKSLTGRFEECLSVTHVQLKIQNFMAPDVDELIRTTPTALLNIHKTPKIGFPGAPKESRSDIYVTITEPNLPHNASFAHPQRGSVQLTESIDKQNLQLTLEVRKSTGERLERCIFPTSNSPGVTAWRTTAIQRGTAWRQTIRLAIPSQDVPQCHLIMSIADAPNFPFALAWMPLWANGAFIEDGTHMPLLYVYDKFTSRQENGRGAYLDMEWDSRPFSSSQSYALQSGSASTLRIETFLCSTELTQDQVLLGVLNWKSQPAEQLSVLLRQLPFVQDIELVKLGAEVWGALFSIITEKSGQEEFEDLVLNSLVVSCAITRDRRFNKDAVVKKYIDEVFDFPYVSLPILRSLQRLFTRTKDYQNSRHLNSTIKSGNLLMHLVIQSRNLYLAKQTSLGNSGEGMTGEMFNNEIKKLFDSFQSLMRNPSPALIGSKTLLMQHMSEWAILLRRSVPRKLLWELGWTFIESTNGVTGKLLLHRLSMIMEYYKIMVPYRDEYMEEGLDIDLVDQKVSDWITPYWGATRHVTDQYREQIRLCISIATLRGGFFGKQYEAYNTKLLDSYLSLRSAGRLHKTIFTPLFPQTYPFPTSQVDSEIPIDEGLVEIAACLVSFRETPLEDNIFDPERIMAVFEVFTSIITGEAYPKSWLTLSLYHHREFLFCCQKFFIYMKQYNLPEPEQPELFRTDLWKSLFTTLLAIVSSENLALETFPEQKRRAVWKIAGDVREIGAGLIARCWSAIGWEVNQAEREQYGLERLGGWQVQYVPHLVGPIIELCLSVHAGLRTTAVQILQSMIISEWSISGDLAVIQHEVVDCLNYLLRHKNMAESAQQKLFIIELMDLFEPLAETNDNELWEAFKDLISVVEDLLDLLVVVHSPDTSDAFRTMNTLRLMDFLRDMQKEDIFISYVHTLADNEAQARCFKEAGLALRLHAELYEWDTNKTVDALKSPLFPSQTAFERREQLFFEMIRHFEEGAAYGCALECYRELADQYEHTSFDFAKLARTQRSMAKCFELITKGECQTPRYFKVVYKGLGFPPNLRDKQYIFEGNGSERLVTFTDRLQREHPSARLVNATDNTEGEGQYLLVTAVTPYRDLKHPLYQRSKVGFAIKEYVLSDSPVNFAVTTRRHSPKTGVQDQWVEKTVYTTAEVFPTILKRSEVIAEEVLPLSPIQTAIERTVRKASELWTLERRLREGDESSSFNLMDAIKSSVEPNSSTSVAQYREMLPKGHETNNASGDDKTKKSTEDQMQAALRIALSDFTYMLRHCFSSFGRSMPSSEYQKLFSQFQVTFAPEIALLGPMPAIAAHEIVNPLQFSDPSFQVKPPTPSKDLASDVSEAQDMAPTGMSRIKAALSSETRTPSRGNRFSMLLRRKPSTADSNEGPTGSIANVSTKHDRNPFNNIRKYATGASNSSSNINEQRDPPRSADVTSDRSTPVAGNGKFQQGAAMQSPASGRDWASASRDDGSNAGGPVYTAITGAKDAYRQGGFSGSHAGSVKHGGTSAIRPPTSHSNGTATTTGRRLAELRKGLAARKFGNGDAPGLDGSTDVMGVRVDMIQRRYARKNAAKGSRQQLGPMEFINIGRVGVH